MKSFNSFEDALLDSGEVIKKTGLMIINNMGKVIAAFVSLIMLAVTFTDIKFAGVFTKDLFSSMLLLLTSAYIIYFSLEDAGEKCGEETEEFKKAKEKYDTLRMKVTGNDIESLRAFCIEYCEKEMRFRKRNSLISFGLSEQILEEYKNGKVFDKKTLKTIHRVNKIKPSVITPKVLLCREKGYSRSELENPEKRKIPILIIKLMPSTLCMIVTISVILSAKEGLTPSDILNGILKLSALPLIGFRGYSAGYSYSKHAMSSWMETKSKVLEDFFSKTSEI